MYDFYCSLLSLFQFLVEYFEVMKTRSSDLVSTLATGRVRLHQIPAIPESESRIMPFDYIIPELEWPEFNSADSGLETEFKDLPPEIPDAHGMLIRMA